MARRVSRLIRQSLEYAFARYPQVTGYVKEHSQTMSEQVMRQHIDLYVNNYSLDLGEDGKKAIRELYAVFNSQQQPGTGNFQELFMENN
jgi:1,4-dihydroxy-6-naphthoate synthase